MTTSSRKTALIFPAASALLVLTAAGQDGFRWSWDKSNPSAPPPSGTSSVSFAWGWQTSAADRAVEPVKTPAPAERAGAGTVDASAYNELLRENLDLRRKLTDTAVGESQVVRENARLTTEVKSLETQIANLAGSLQELKQRDPSGVNARDLATRLTTVEAEKQRLEEALAKLTREADDRRRTAAEVPASVPPAGSPVEPGSDLFRRLEKENLELRERLLRLEADHKRTVEAQTQIAGAEARSRETVAELSGREKSLRDELAEAKGREQKNRDLVERLPRLEGDLAALSRDVEEKKATLAEKERQIEALREELRRRGDRLTGAERTAAAMEQAKKDVQKVAEREKRDMHYNMGVMYARDGKSRSAEQEYLKALQMDPSDADVHYNLGILYDESIGDKDKAAMHYRRFLMLKPHGPDAEAVKGWLMAIELRH